MAARSSFSDAVRRASIRLRRAALFNLEFNAAVLSAAGPCRVRGDRL